MSIEHDSMTACQSREDLCGSPQQITEVFFEVGGQYRRNI
jgi:hypothetical protein